MPEAIISAESTEAPTVRSGRFTEPHIAWMGTGIELLGSHAFIRFEGTGRTDLERRRQGER